MELHLVHSCRSNSKEGKVFILYLNVFISNLKKGKKYQKDERLSTYIFVPLLQPPLLLVCLAAMSSPTIRSI